MGKKKIILKPLEFCWGLYNLHVILGGYGEFVLLGVVLIFQIGLPTYLVNNLIW